MTLIAALHDFDGKAITILSEAEVKFGNEPDYLNALIKNMTAPDGHVSSGATWLMKSALEKGRQFTEQQTICVIDGLELLCDWQAQLHICQIAHYLEVPKGKAKAFADWLQGLLDHKKPFLRAWSMHGLVAISKQHSGYVHMARAALENAANDSAASVRARARNTKL